MLTEERFAEILRMLGEEKSVTVQELTERLATSESTIRRDLTALAEKGLLVKVHGGATALEMDYTTKDVEITSRMTQNVDEKSLIGKYAASLIEKEDFVYLDSGSSIAQMLKYMTGSGAVFVTNGIAHAQSLTKKPMKGMLTGPVTILNWSFPREDISLKESTYQIALAIRDEVLDLEANGIRVIQVDEAALREKLPLRRSDWYKEYLDWAIPAFRLVHSGVDAQTQIHTHMCYSEFTDIIRAIDDMDADVITFEASRSDLVILDSLKENHFKTEVGPGVYDIHSPRVPSVEEIKAALEKMLTRIAPEKLWVNPDCGLKTRGVPETVASLKHLVEAAKELRKEA